MSDLPPVVAATDLDSLVTAVVREDAEVDLTDCIRLEGWENAVLRTATAGSYGSQRCAP
jgi:hypothetical protein